MIMNRITVFIITLVLFSCARNNKAPEIEPQKLETKEDFEIVLELKTSVEDDFKVLVNNIEVDEFQKKNIQIVEAIPPSTGFEKLKANFGNKNISNFILINLGKKEKEVEFNFITFKYGQKSIVVDANNFDEFMRYNKFVSFKKDNFTIETKKVDNKHNPVISAKRILINKLLQKEGN
ncbi:hypothetical protein C1T31_01185 [Hanstruepera neustonica]|uniref:Lipoprotein n=2 Tax=Hanstruepera neustonica TaxID=1445657 RepID=A0A2K1E3E7_9FLAO|nr:hypothetical protein C1T31_01185 [Hanstruepera neustonica]